MSVAIVTMLRFDAGGLIAERWPVADFLTTLEQIGATRAPAAH